MLVLFGVPVGSGFGDGSSGSCSNITINGGSVNACSTEGAGHCSGYANDSNGSCSNITIINGSVNASSTNGNRSLAVVVPPFLQAAEALAVTLPLVAVL